MPEEFKIKRRVQFAETDAAAIMHFANYYRMMEEVEHAFWRSIGMSVLTLYNEQHLSWPRVATGCEYFAPAYFEDELELALSIAKVGNRSVTYAVEFRRDGGRIAAGRTTAVCCTVSEGVFKPTPIPEGIRAKLRPLVQATAAQASRR